MKLRDVYEYKDRMERFFNIALDVFDDKDDAEREYGSRGEIFNYMNKIQAEIAYADTAISGVDSRELIEMVKEVKRREAIAERHKDYAMDRFYDILSKEEEFVKGETKILSDEVLQIIEDNNSLLHELEDRIDQHCEYEVVFFPKYEDCYSFSDIVRKGIYA